MKWPSGVAWTLALVFASQTAAADCHWGWYCDQEKQCGYVPYCDSPRDVPPPFKGMKPKDPDAKPIDPSLVSRKPLPGFKPIAVPPPGTAHDPSKQPSSATIP